MKTRYIAFILTLFPLASCSDFLSEYSQDEAYVRSYVDLDELLLGDGYMTITAPKWVAATYLTDAEPVYYPYVHLMADEVKENITTTGGVNVSYSVQNGFFGWYTWQKEPGIDYQGLFVRAEDHAWKKLYMHIMTANMVLSEIGRFSGKTGDDRTAISRIKGEAHFLRAAYYFTLVNIYGKPYKASTAATDPGVPVKLAEYIEDMLFSRNTVQQVYDQILRDIEAAEDYLADTPAVSIYRANLKAAQLLKARVYLYMQNWKDAASYADKVIDGTYSIANLNDFTTTTDNDRTFFMERTNPEVIFNMGSGDIAANINGGTTGLSVSDGLFGAYADNDLRKQYYVWEDTAIGYVDYVKIPALGRTTLSDCCLFRLSEAYLIKAEASAYAGDESAARNAVNTLRRKRIEDATYIDVTESGEALTTLIRDERRRELCFEGHRWFDLRRYTVCEKYPYSKKLYNSQTVFENRYVGYPVYGYQDFPIQTRIYELAENDPAYTLTIPVEVINFNTGMVQNERPVREPYQTINY